MSLRERCWGSLALAVLLAHSATARSAEEEFKFDASEFEKKPFELGGYLELRPERFTLNPGSTGYKLNYPAGFSRDSLERTTGALQFDGKFVSGIVSARFRSYSQIQRDAVVKDESNRFYEAAVSLRPNPGLTVDIGKQALQWGKGYAFNPVGFVQRRKDPNDPELAREGYTSASADFIRNFDGPLQTVAFTPVLLPVGEKVNDDFGKTGYVNFAAKLYFLYRDTDIDLVYMAKGSRPARFGLDFSRNLLANLEVHGEWARTLDAEKPVVDSSGRVTTQRSSPVSALLGMRYLTERDTTYIVEYYRNGTGYGQGEIGDFYGFVDRAFAGAAAPGGDALVQSALNLARSGYGQPNPMRDYLYVQASQKEPFDILYFTPSIAMIANLGDRSLSVTPDLLYTGIKNVELRLRMSFLVGGGGTEFGEKPNSNRIELRARFYF